jgi:transposase
MRSITKNRLKLLVNKMSVNKIASVFGVSKSVVYRAIRKWNIKNKQEDIVIVKRETE